MKKKSTRNRYFQVLICLGIDRIKLDVMSSEDLVKLLVAVGSITQPVLKTILYNLRIKYEGKGLYLKDFNVQLEKKEDGSPFWNIFLETNIVTTKRFLAKLFSSKFLENKNGIDNRVKVYSLSELKKPNRKKLFSIANENFFPGFFNINRSFIHVQELSKREEVQELIVIAQQKQLYNKNSAKQQQ